VSIVGVVVITQACPTRGSGAMTSEVGVHGSAALAARGLPTEPGDIDVRVDDAAPAGRIFDDALVTPVERMDGWVAAYDGRAFRHAIVEWMAEPHAALDDPSAPHEQGPFVAGRIEAVTWRGCHVRVAPLDAQLRVCERRGLTDRAALIRAAMRGGEPRS
jgi:hypothetical protein